MRKLGLVAVVLIGSSSFSAAANEPVCEMPMVSCSAKLAASVNPYLLLDRERDELGDLFPAMEQRELDILWFKIADINSQR